jgi:hypothetical protein
MDTFRGRHRSHHLAFGAGPAIRRVRHIRSTIHRVLSILATSRPVLAVLAVVRPLIPATRRRGHGHPLIRVTSLLVWVVLGAGRRSIPVMVFRLADIPAIHRVRRIRSTSRRPVESRRWVSGGRRRCRQESGRHRVTPGLRERPLILLMVSPRLAWRPDASDCAAA